jgi:hypothetical protein
MSSGDFPPGEGGTEHCDTNYRPRYLYPPGYRGVQVSCKQVRAQVQVHAQVQVQEQVQVQPQLQVQPQEPVPASARATANASTNKQEQRLCAQQGTSIGSDPRCAGSGPFRVGADMRIAPTRRLGLSVPLKAYNTSSSYQASGGPRRGPGAGTPLSSGQLASRGTPASQCRPQGQPPRRVGGSTPGPSWQRSERPRSSVGGLPGPRHIVFLTV